MSDLKRFFVLMCSMLFLFGFSSTILAEENGLAIVDHNIKAVATVSSGRYIKIAWQVKVHNETNEILTRVITLSFLDGNRESLGDASKTSELKAGETTTISDTVVLPVSVAKRIATGVVTTNDIGA